MPLETIHGEPIESESNVQIFLRKPAPVDILPPEILAEIFVHSVENCCVEIRTGSGPLMPVAEVCSLWRVIAFSEPRLWESIVIHKRLSPQRLLLLHAILSNRGGEGIVMLETSPMHPEEWEAIQDLLLSYPFRLRRLSLNDVIFVPPHFQVGMEAFKHVEEISITTYNPHVTDQQELRVFASCLDLRSISLVSRTFDDTTFASWPFRVILPWGQLEHLNLLSTSVPVLANILRLCPRLVSCKALCSGSHGKTSPPFPPQFEMPRLNLFYLYQRCDDDHDVTQLLDLLTVPKLRSMTISSLVYPWPQDGIIRMIGRSECDIEYFFGDRDSIRRDFLIPLLRAMPQLHHCCIWLETPVTGSMFDEISRDNLVSQLEILEGWKIELLSLESLKRFLESRWIKSASGIYEGLRDVTLVGPVEELTVAGEALLYLNHHGRTVELTSFSIQSA